MTMADEIRASQPASRAFQGGGRGGFCARETDLQARGEPRGQLGTFLRGPLAGSGPDRPQIGSRSQPYAAGHRLAN